MLKWRLMGCLLTLSVCSITPIALAERGTTVWLRQADVAGVDVTLAPSVPLQHVAAGDQLVFDIDGLQGLRFRLVSAATSRLGNRVMSASTENGERLVLVADPAGNRQGVIVAGDRQWRLSGFGQSLIISRAEQGTARKFDDAPRRPMANVHSGVAFAAAPRAAASVSSATDVDVLVYLDTDLTSGRSVIDQLNALANAAYAESGAGVNIRIVGVELVDIDDSLPANDVLDDMDARNPPFTDLAELRNTYGADLVVSLRGEPPTDSDSCGVAYISAYHGFYYSANPFGVVHYDPRGSGGGYYCSDYTWAHEIGHLLGAAHDRDNAIDEETGEPDYGAFPYSYGFGVDGIFGTIMSYIDPEVSYFSNPEIDCGARACGVAAGESDEADNVRTFNQTVERVAAYRATVVDGPIEGGYTLDFGQPAVICKASAPTSETSLQSLKTGLTNTSVDASWDVICPVPVGNPGSKSTNPSIDIELYAGNQGTIEQRVECALTQRNGALVVSSFLVATTVKPGDVTGGLLGEGLTPASALDTFAVQCMLPPLTSLVEIRARLTE